MSNIYRPNSSRYRYECGPCRALPVSEVRPLNLFNPYVNTVVISSSCGNYSKCTPCNVGRGCYKDTDEPIKTKLCKNHCKDKECKKYIDWLCDSLEEELYLGNYKSQGNCFIVNNSKCKKKKICKNYRKHVCKKCNKSKCKCKKHK